MRIKVLIADGNYIAREGLRYLVEKNSDFKLIDVAENTDSLKRILSKKKADVLIIDQLSFGFNVNDLDFISENFSDVKTITINPSPTKLNIQYAVEKGVISCLLKECDQNEITEAIYSTNKKEKFFCSQIVENILNAALSDEAPIKKTANCEGIKISTRETEIIQCVAEGLSNKEIADKLYLSVHTVTTHRKNIMSKLNINNTAGLIMYAIKQNLINYDEVRS